MRDNMFAVLMYLLEKHMGENFNFALNQEILTDELKQVGFHRNAIGKAFHWLKTMKRAESGIEQKKLQNASTNRIFAQYERQRLGEDCLMFVLFLQRVGILTAVTRELVLDCLLAIDEDKLTVVDVKWVVLIVLFNQPREKTALKLMEQLVLHDESTKLH